MESLSKLPNTHSLGLCLSEMPVNTLVRLNARRLGGSFESCFGTVWNSIYAEGSLEPTHELGHHISSNHRDTLTQPLDVYAYIPKSCLQKCGLHTMQPSL